MKEFIQFVKIIFTVLFFFIAAANAQELKVQGNISTSSTFVQNAKVTFTDKNDSQKTYSGLTDANGNYYIRVDVTSVNPGITQPSKFELEQNYPNPFSGMTAIPYDLNTQTDVHVTIYDILGRVIRKIPAGEQSVGSHMVQWDGNNSFGQRVSAGVYLYRLEAAGESKIKKMVFNAGKSGITLPGMYLSLSKSINPNQKNTTAAKTFTVYVENLSNTIPSILTKQFEVIVGSDTTIDFSVEKTPAFIATVYIDSLQQIIRGFGAANILPWRPDMTDDNINKAFGMGDGQIGFSILRLRVPTSANEFLSQVKSAKKAADMGVTVFASPWSPPASMKSNNNTVGGYLKESSYADYAAHLKSFVDYMGNSGVPLYAISVQNEPDVTVTYESCDWVDTEMVKFLKENAGTIGTKIIAPESFNFNKTISDAILNDPDAAANLDIVGGHLYGGGLSAYPLATSKGKEHWMTEYLDLDTTWAKNLATGKQINDCMYLGMNAYVWWYIIRFYGPIHEDGYVTKRGYVMSQYARFIRPGYYRVKVNGNPQSNVYLTSYFDSTSSKVVIVAINNGSVAVEQSFEINSIKVAGITPYTTTSIKNCQQEEDVNVSSNIFTVTLEPSSITTFVSK